MNRDSKLSPLVAQLRGCESRDAQAMRETVKKAWDALRRDGIEEVSVPSKSVLTAVALNSKIAAQLLTIEEQAQLSKLADLVLERYQQRTIPPNKLGKLIAGIVKEL